MSIIGVALLMKTSLITSPRADERFVNTLLEQP